MAERRFRQIASMLERDWEMALRALECTKNTISSKRCNAVCLLGLTPVLRNDVRSSLTTNAKRSSAGAEPINSVEVLVSGGIDSAALLAFYLSQQLAVRALFVDFNQPAAKQESRAVKALCKHYGIQLSIVTVKSEATFSSGEITGRNAFLVFSALMACGARPGIIALGIHEGPPYYDCGEGFLKSIRTVVDGYTAGKIEVAAPLLKWGKQVIWEFCKEAQVPVDLTYSCENGGVPPCGNCLSCKDRRVLYAM